jgi:hypothetical protein
MRYRAFFAAAPIAALLATTAALAPAAAASPSATGPTTSVAPTSDRPGTVTVSWLYEIEADWVRMHTRPTTRSTTRALARRYDESRLQPQRAPQSNGFTLVADANNGVTGWVQTSYVDERFCLNGQCQ